MSLFFFAYCHLPGARLSASAAASDVYKRQSVTTASGADQLQRIPLLNRVGPTELKSEPVDLKTALNIFLVSADLVDLVPFI